MIKPLDIAEQLMYDERMRRRQDNRENLNFIKEHTTKAAGRAGKGAPFATGAALMGTAEAQRSESEKRRPESTAKAHKAAGEGHLKAAKAAEHMPELSAAHKAQAAEHAAAAGGEWDEGKHPRDENGKFA